MQNRYVGDVGDFGKFGLLRFLNGETAQDGGCRLRLGVIWYMYPDERHGSDKNKINSDGRHISYSVPTGENIRLYGACDRELWAKLGHLVGYDARCVHCLERADLLPCNTQYYRPPLFYVPKLRRGMKEAVRNHWFGEALKATKDARLIYVDPDTGIGQDNNKYGEKGPKYAYREDLQAIWERGQSLVVYQHFERKPSYDQIREKAEWLGGTLDTNPPVAFWFRRGTARVFFVMPHPLHKSSLEERIQHFPDECWSQHFERVP